LKYRTQINTDLDALKGGFPQDTPMDGDGLWVGYFIFGKFDYRWVIRE
jgi:hypothetical protein